MNINLGDVKVGGEYKFVVRDSSGKITNETHWQNNLLTDKFFEMTVQPTSMYAFVGTGSQSPQGSDTKLGSILGSSSTTAINSGSRTSSGDKASGFTMTTETKVFRWAVGAISGNISEWGWALESSTSTYILRVRSLIKDSNGNPTTLTVTSSDQLEIWWRLTKKWVGTNEMADVTSQFTLNNVNTDVTIKNINPSQFNSNSPYRWNTEIWPSCVANDSSFSAHPHAATLVQSTSENLSVVNANSGDDLPSSSLTIEQRAVPVFTLSNPVAGTAKISLKATFPVLGSGADSEMLGVILSTSSINSVNATQVIAVAVFNPRFIKGVDKVLSVTFSYNVTRA
ncbi:TPA: hypothetical protein QDZ84_002501 [Shewanella algae]|uniref:hypothetical protein n=1 Tax=Shewanella algae TaxID=38313 RepID=UPI001C568063|nr:hypothetical protein [Shewanella algae]HDS1207486.1 hypothetical protein [Shewanella algae]